LVSVTTLCGRRTGNVEVANSLLSQGHSGNINHEPVTQAGQLKEMIKIKVNIYETCEVDDTQRKQIGALIDGGTTLRAATRQEMKDWVWSQGSDWAGILAAEFGDSPSQPEAAEPEPVAEDEDLEGLDDLL
jgi:hypothetical protein